MLLGAVLAAAMLSQPMVAETTYNLLESSANWTLNGYAYNADSDSLSKEGWGASTAIYNAPLGYREGYVVGDDSALTFSMSYIATNIPDKDGVLDNDAVFNLVFSGTNDQAIMVGNDYYGTTEIQYGLIADTNASQYFKEYELTPFKDGDTPITRAENQSYTIDGTITQANGNYTLTLTLSVGDKKYTSSTLDLGGGFDINRVAFSSDGGNRTLTALSITGQVGSLSEVYSATIIGSQTVAGASWSLDGSSVQADSIDMTGGTAWLRLAGSGENASIAFADGTNLDALQVTGGALELIGEGGLTTGDLVVDSGATATVGSSMTASNLIISGNLIVGSKGILTTANTTPTFLSKITGDGRVVFTETSTIDGSLSSQFAGTVEIAAEKTLFLGKKQDRIHQLSNATIQLNNQSRLEVQGLDSSLKALYAADSSILYFEDGDTGKDLLTIGEVNIASGKTLTVQNHWEGVFKISSLNSKGNLAIDLSGSMSTVIAAVSQSGAISNKQVEHSVTLGTSATSVLNLGGNVTNAGTLNILGQIGGSSTISGGTINVKEGSSVNGTITFGSAVTLEGSLVNSGTLTFDTAVDFSRGITNTGTLNVGAGYTAIGTLVNDGTFKLAGDVHIADVTKLEDGGVTYSDGENGYITGATYYVVKSKDAQDTVTLTGASKLYQGASEIGTITSSGNNLVVSIQNENADSGLYYLITKGLTVDGSDTNPAMNATGYYVAKGQTLTIAKDQSSTMTAGKILAETVGEGNITLAANASFEASTSSQATGTLTVQDATLEVTMVGGNHYNSKNACTDLSSFSAVTLSGATIKYIGLTTSIYDVTVTNKGAKLLFNDMGNNPGENFRMLGTTTLNGTLDIGSYTLEGGAWKYGVEIEKLVGTSDSKLNFTSASEPGSLKIGSLSGYKGAISMTKGNGSATLTITTGGDTNLSGFALAKGATANVSVSSGTIGLGAGKLDASTLTLQRTDGAYTVDYTSLDVAGTSALQTADGSNTNNSWEAQFNIGKLTGSDATLKLRSGSNTGAATVFNLNGGEGTSYSGVIEFGGCNNAGDGRKSVLNLKDSSVTQNTEIRFNAENDKNTAYLALGAEEVQVKGLSTIAGKSQIVSGAVAVGATAIASDGTNRTLVINTQGGNYTTSAAIGADVSLTKQGEGSQTFSGDTSAFNGAIEVNNGKLRFTKTDGSVTVSSLSLNGGLLDVTGSLTLTKLTIDLDAYSTEQLTHTLISAGSFTYDGDLSSYDNVTVGTYTTKVTQSDTGLTLTFSEIVTPGGDSLTTTVTGFESYTDGMLTLKVDGTLAEGMAVVIEGFGSGVLDSILQNVKTGTMVGITLTDGTTSIVGTAEQNVGFQGAEGIYYGENVDGAWQYNVSYIPEPTTATLSLLALCGLAARRRRASR